MSNDKKPKQTRAPRPNQSVQTNPGDNQKYINHSLEVAQLSPVDMSDNLQVAQRAVDYFNICAKNDMKPSVAGLALAMGIDRKELWEYRTGRKGNSIEVMNTLKKAALFLDVLMNDYMQNGKINPVSGIFLMKNNFDYADKQEVVLTPNNPLGEQIPTEEIAQRYIESIPEDLDES